MTDPTPTTGRRSAAGERRWDLLVGLAILLPVVVSLCIAVIGREDDTQLGARPPATADLSVASVGCPAAVGARGLPARATRVPGVPGGRVDVATAPGIQGPSGKATLTDGGKLSVGPGKSVEVGTDGGVTLLDGRGTAAPGLVAGRSEPLAVPECRGPSYDEWLVGLGASARYATSLELVNPDGGDAVVDLEVLGPNGPIEEPALRGITIPGHGVKRIDLAKVAPRRSATAAHFTVSRGRVVATARSTWDPLGNGRVTTDFLPSDPEPATDGLILGIPKGAEQTRLAVANPGADEVRVTPQIVTPQSVFTPTDAREVAVPPHSLRMISLDALLSSDAAKGALGIRVSATGPVASSVRTLVKDDLVLLGPVPELAEPTTAVLPAGAKELLLGGATKAGTVQVQAFDAAGKQVAEKRVEMSEGGAARLALPPKAVSITLTAENMTVRAMVLIPATGRRPGLATLRLRPAEVRARIPSVTPR